MLAGYLGWALFDTDAQIEWSSGQSIPAIFASKGEAGFRDLEEAVVRQALSGQRRVVATGGGAILREASRQLMHERSLVIWLDAPTEALIARLRLHNEQRPLLASGDPVARLNALRQDREPIYAATAHLRIETTGMRHAEIVAQILDRYKHLTEGTAL
jgi:shikimate kinase